MAVTRVLDRVRDGIEKVLVAKASPDDQVEFDVNLGTIVVHNDEEGSCEQVTVIALYGTLAMPEMGEQCRVCLTNMIPARFMEEESEVTEAATELWNDLVESRVLHSLNAEMAEVEKKVAAEEPPLTG